jgi:hypothetical protein
MSETVDDEVRPVLQPTEGATDEPVEVGAIAWQRVFHDACDPGIALLLGIELGSVGRQVGHREVVRMPHQEG